MSEQFDKVDRALEIQVIDWLQWSEFPDHLAASPSDSDMAQLTLQLLSKRKKVNISLQRDIEAWKAIAAKLYIQHYGLVNAWSGVHCKCPRCRSIYATGGELLIPEGGPCPYCEFENLKEGNRFAKESGGEE